MADEITPELRQQRMKEFLSMLPLTLELAGLPKGALGTTFTEGQMEVRVSVIRNAYKLARQLLKDVGEAGV
jgi:hypothetical protein